MRLRVLGTLEVTGAGAPVRSPKLRRLLAALIVHAGAVVPLDRLADIVWADAAPRQVDAALHSLVSRLRATLGAHGVEVLTRPPGYLLRIAPGELDAAVFGDLLAGAATEDAPAVVAALLDEALALWRGPAYAEFADEDFARPEAARLHELRAGAEEDRVQADLELGRPAAAIARLDPLVAAEPLRERRHALLVLALHRAGRQADALAAYTGYRQRLADELGLDPGPELRRLEAAVLAADPALDWRPSPPLAGSLPPAPVLVGRDAAVAELAGQLRANRVLTLTGPGGVGKTGLALRVATDVRREFADGAWLVELAAVAAGEEVAPAVTTALVTSASGSGAADATDRLVAHLQGRRLLLVLDNCEHVIDAAAALVAAVGAACPGLTVLATSREPLGIPGERVRPVPPLPVPEVAAAFERVAAAPAVVLFLERAAATAPGFVLTADNADAVAEVCRRLDGLPLALELAAARMRMMSPAELVSRLPSRLRFLRSPGRTAQERHRTLRAVIDWSYRLLEPGQRRVLDRLGVFAGSFTLAAAEAVARDDTGAAAEDEDDVAVALADLVDRSMVSASVGGAGPSRYTLLQTVRDYARERLDERGEADVLRRAHARYVVASAERTGARLRGSDAVAGVGDLTAELDELRAAHAWATAHDPDLAAALVAALVDYVDIRMPPEVFGWAEAVLAVGAGGAALPTVYAVAAGGARFAGDLERAGELVARGLASTTGEDDPRRRHLLYLRQEVELFTGRLDDALRTGAESERLGAAAGDRRCVLQAQATTALAHSYAGRTAEATVAADALLARARRDGDPLMVPWACYVAGEVRAESHPDTALELLEEALRRGRATGERYVTGVALVSAASLRARRGVPQRAIPLFLDVLSHWRAAGNWTQQ